MSWAQWIWRYMAVWFLRTVRSEMNLLVLSQPDDNEIYFQDTMSEIVGLSSDMLILNVFQVFGLWGCWVEEAGQWSPQVFGDVRHWPLMFLIPWPFFKNPVAYIIWIQSLLCQSLRKQMNICFLCLYMLCFVKHYTDFVMRPGETLRLPWPGCRSMPALVLTG